MMKMMMFNFCDRTSLWERLVGNKLAIDPVNKLS